MFRGGVRVVKQLDIEGVVAAVAGGLVVADIERLAGLAPVPAGWFVVVDMVALLRQHCTAGSSSDRERQDESVGRCHRANPGEELGCLDSGIQSYVVGRVPVDCCS